MEVSGKLAGEKHDLKCCEHCQFENVTSAANGACRECREYMCNTCFRQHLKSKRNRNHEMIDINDPDITARKISEEVENCKQHDNEAIKFYCRKHDVVGCGDCIILEHSTCKPEYIKDLSKNIRDTEVFINLKRKIEHIENKNESNIENIRKNRNGCKAMHEEVLAEISKFRTDINTYLDEAEAAITSEMEQLLSENNNRFDQLDNDCAKCLSDIETLKQTLDPTVQKENVLFIQTVKNKASVLEIERELSKTVRSVCEVKHYEFVPIQQLASIIKSSGKLGKLNISNLNESKRDEITTMEKNVDTLTLMEPKRPLQQDKDLKADVRTPLIVVGSRVEANHVFGGVWLHPGTVTAVLPDGTVNVKLDATGLTLKGRREGEVKLI